MELAATVTGRATVTAELRVIQTPESATHETQRLEEIGFRVVWLRSVPDDGGFVLRVYDDEGNLIDGGVGDDPQDAILEVAERLLPPSD